MSGENIILTDQPLESPEQDELGYAPFAEKVANVIKRMEVKGSIVFAVYGKWGSGKTTFLNFVTYHLKDSDSITIVKFNPWYFSGREKLIRQFLYSLKLAFKESTKLKNIAKTLEPFMEALGEIPNIGGFFKAGWKFIKASQKDIEKAKEEVINQLKKIHGKIVVIIDDIDRLTADEIRDLFAIIKAIVDFPNMVYILAFDKDVVVRALEKIQGGKGEDYLEKIVQVPIELPLADKSLIRKMLFKELDQVFSGTPAELFEGEYLLNVYFDGIDPFIDTIRDVKRLCNTVKLTYPIVKGEVNFVDFIAIETLRVFCSDAYTVIKNNPDMFCGSGSDSQELKQFHQGWISSLNLPDNLKESIKNLLKRLFPKLESVFGNTIYGPEWEREWRKKCRVCSKEIFPRFFSFSIRSDDLPRHEMINILNSAYNRETFGKYLQYLAEQIRFDGSTKLSIFLERMEDYTSEIPQDHIPIIIETFFTIGDKLIIPEDELKSFLYPFGNDTRIKRIIFQLLQRYDEKDKRFEILKNAFEKGQSISIMTKVLLSLWQQHGKYGGTKEPAEYIILPDEEHLYVLQEITLNKIRESAKEDRLLNSPLLPGILYLWKEWGSESEVRDWVSRVVNSDEKLPVFLSKFLKKTLSATMTSRVAEIQFKLDLNSLKDFVDLDFLEKRCMELLSNNNLNHMDKLAVELFLDGRGVKKPRSK